MTVTQRKSQAAKEETKEENKEMTSDYEEKFVERQRSHSSGPAMRNLPLFIFLTALVFLFYVFYIYQAQGTELTMTREQLEMTSRDLRAVKENLIDAKAALEKTELSEKTLRTMNEDLSKKTRDCQDGLRSAKLQADSLNHEKTKLDEDTRGKDKELMDLRSELTELRRNNTALDQIAQAQIALAQQLNQTLQIVQKELAEAKEKPAAPADAHAQPVKAEETNVDLGKIVKPQNGQDILTNEAAAVPATVVAPADETKVEKAAQEQAGVLEPPKKEGKDAERQAEEQEEHEMAEADAVRRKENGGEIGDQ